MACNSIFGTLRARWREFPFLVFVLGLSHNPTTLGVLGQKLLMEGQSSNFDFGS